MAAHAQRLPVVPNGVLGMIVFVLTELMLFAGLISAFQITKSSAPFGWPPPDQPRLPIEVSAANTALLVLSAAALVWAGIRFRDDPRLARAPMLVALLLAGTFVVVQGVEWASLLGRGLTLTSSQLGAFFYLIVGCHALHAVAAIAALGWALVRLHRDQLDKAQLWTVQIFWYFVVGVWPVLYVQVYL